MISVKNSTTVCSHILSLLISFFISLCIAIGLLVAASFLPQNPVDENVFDSAELIDREGSDFYIADHSRATRMSNNSESIMLLESKTMSSDNILSIFSNPRYSYEKNDSSVEDLMSYVSGEEGANLVLYSRYWMGFRATLRLLLQKLDYYQIRRYTATIFFVLLFSAVCSVSNHINSKVALLFAASIILVRPHVIAVSLQAFTCFCIALLAMILVPYVERHPKVEPIFFMEIGIATMYFDFYTTPVLTFGLPMIYLYMLRWEKRKENRFVTIFADSIAWLFGYAFMWLSKLVLTQIFTTEDALSEGLGSFLYRIQASGSVGEEHRYTLFDALYEVAMVLMSDNTGARIFLGCGFLVLLIFGVLFIGRKRPAGVLLKNIGILAIALYPIAWFAVASQPTAIHAYFQYRGIAVTFFGLLCYMYLCLYERKDIVCNDQ